MMLWLWILFALEVLVPLPLRADDVLARERFDAGVTAAGEGRWDDAAKLLEASLQEKDKPTTRYNLVLAYTELNRPLEVARHALGFLTFPATGGLVAARDMVQEKLADARAKLAVLSLDAIPEGARLAIDGSTPALLYERRAYVLPGRHQLHLRIADGTEEMAEVELQGGQTEPWPRSLAPSSVAAAAEARSLPMVAPAPPAASASWRRPLAWTLGIAGAVSTLTAISLYIAAEHQGSQLSHMQVMEPGYADAADAYGRLKRPVSYFALAGGALMAGGVALGTELVRRGSWGWAIGSLLAGTALAITGSVFMAQSPDAWVADTSVYRLSRERGSLLLAASLPLFAYSIRFLVRRMHASSGPSH
jgi:hypothetical protein